MAPFYSECAENVYRIFVPCANFRLSGTNCYLVKGTERSLLIDTGAETDEGERTLRAALEALNIDTAKTDFFVTHLHLDHAGLLRRIAPHGARVYIGAVEFAVASPDANLSAQRRTARLFESEGLGASEAEILSRAAYNSNPPDSEDFDVALLDEGACLDLGSYRLRALFCPGHTQGQLCLLREEDQLLFCGDHVLAHISPSISLFDNGRDGLQQYLDCLRNLADSDVSTMLPGHGKVITDPIARIEKLIRHHNARVSLALELVRKNAGISGIELTRGLHWNVPYESWDEIPAIQKSIIVHSGLVVLRHLTASKTIERRIDPAGNAKYFPM